MSRTTGTTPTSAGDHACQRWTNSKQRRKGYEEVTGSCCSSPVGFFI